MMDWLIDFGVTVFSLCSWAINLQEGFGHAERGILPPGKKRIEAKFNFYSHAAIYVLVKSLFSSIHLTAPLHCLGLKKQHVKLDRGLAARFSVIEFNQRIKPIFMLGFSG